MRVPKLFSGAHSTCGTKCQLHPNDRDKHLIKISYSVCSSRIISQKWPQTPNYQTTQSFRVSKFGVGVLWFALTKDHRACRNTVQRCVIICIGRWMRATANAPAVGDLMKVLPGMGSLSGVPETSRAIDKRCGKRTHIAGSMASTPLGIVRLCFHNYLWYCPAFFSCCVLRRVKLGWNTLNCSLFNGQCWYMCQDAQCLKPLKQPLLSSCKFPLLWLTLQPLSFAFLTCSHTFLAGFQHFNFFLFFFLQLKVTGSILGGSLSGWRTCSAKRNKTDDFSLCWQCYLQVLSSPYKRVLACL